MRIWYNNVVDTQRRVIEFDGDRIRIGCGSHNDLVLHSPYIAEQAALLYRRGAQWEILAQGQNGLNIAGQRLDAGKHAEVLGGQAIELFPYTLTIDLPSQAAVSKERQRQRLDQQCASVIADVHRQLLERMDLRRSVDTQKHNDRAYQLTLERHLESLSREHADLASRESQLFGHLAGTAVRDQLLKSLQKPSGADANSSEGSRVHESDSQDQLWRQIVTAVPERERELETSTAYLAKLLDLDAQASMADMTTESIAVAFWDAWAQVEPKLHREFIEYLALQRIKKEIKDIVFGYGPLEDLLRMPSITEIMVVDRDRIFVESAGRIENSGRRFISDEIVESIIQRIVGRVGRRIDKSQPLVDARLSDGSRVNAVIAPLAVSGPTLTIRKFPSRKIIMHDLVALGSLSPVVAEFLRACVLARKNIIVSGGTGTGKTTLLNCLSDAIADSERIVTVEDTAELQLTKQHVVRLETKEANVEGAGQYTIRDLVRNALRMRPDRVVVGECRGPEALDMLQAMNTGHDGSLTTIHANDSHDVSLRLEVLVQMAADLPVSSIRQQIGAAIDCIVQLQRLRDGRRVISQITECVGVNPTSGQLELRDLYLLDPDMGELQPTGQLPSFIGELLEGGELDLSSFLTLTPARDVESLSSEAMEI